MQEDLKGTEPTLNAEAGLTESSAKAAGASGYGDPLLHAGFITKQTPASMAPEERPIEVQHRATSPPVDTPLDLEPVVEGEPALSSEAGLTPEAAKAAGKGHGVADEELHAGFITKQTPLDK